MSLIDGYYGNFNNVDSVWGRVSLVYAKKAALMLNRAGVADVMEYARYGRAVGRHTSLALRRVGMSLASLVSIRNITNQALHARELEELKAARSRQENIKNLITDKIADDENNYGSVKLDTFTLKAFDLLGNPVKEAMILYYEGDREINVERPKEDTSGNMVWSSESHRSKYITLVDLAPRISVGSKKNLVKTQVQGRDYTRKELVSGGDRTFSVSGKIVSNIIDKYPTNDVRKFINIMEYGGIVQVNNMIFGQFNVDRIIIEDYRLEQPECKNEQPYSFTCVAVEPDTDVTIESDTIDLINYHIESRSPDVITNIALDYYNSLPGVDLSLADLLGELI